jgi:hypothetical protein
MVIAVLDALLRVALATALALAAGLKLARPAAARAALAGFGVPAPSAALGALILLEGALAGGVAAGWRPAAALAAALLGAFAAVLAVALRRGAAGRPCGCFGARSRVSAAGLARTGALAAGALALALLPAAPPLSAQGWLGLGLGVALLGVAGLAVAVLALAREVGALRLAVGSQAALDIPHEGPELGSRTDLLAGAPPRPGARVVLLVFSSAGCPMCRTLAPAVDYVAGDPLVDVRVLDEESEREAWAALDVPGSPYVVALGLDGTVLAKGTVNSLPQLEGVVAEALRREVVHA